MGQMNMMEDDCRKISPLYMQRLKTRVESAPWDLFNESKYRQVEEYVRRWHEDDGNFWENFSVCEKDSHIDLGYTLAEMPNDILIKMAADIGIETPGLLPCIPVMKNILGKANASAYANFERAVRDVYDCPDQSVALAALTLEGAFKAIIQDMNPNASVGNLSLSKLTSKVVKEVVKEVVDACDPSTPQEVKTLAAQLRSLGSSIDNLRSDKSTAHGKAPGEYVVDDSLWAETVVNVSATLGIFLWRLYERHTGREAESSGQVPVYCGDISF